MYEEEAGKSIILACVLLIFNSTPHIYSLFFRTHILATSMTSKENVGPYIGPLLSE